jgi:hypothetical protein
LASVADICNVALSAVGADAVVTSISPPDGSVEAGHCARFYPLARKLMIETGPCVFALKRAELAEVDNASEVWSYAYVLPADCIKPLRVLRALDFPYTNASIYEIDKVLTSFEPNEQGGAEYQIEGQVLYTHEPEAVLIYRRDVTDTTKFTPTTVLALGTLLGSFLAGPIVKGMDGVRLAQALRNQATELMAQAGVLDANSSTERHEPMPSSIRARQ